MDGKLQRAALRCVTGTGLCWRGRIPHRCAEPHWGRVHEPWRGRGTSVALAQLSMMEGKGGRTPLPFRRGTSPSHQPQTLTWARAWHLCLKGLGRSTLLGGADPRG